MNQQPDLEQTNCPAPEAVGSAYKFTMAGGEAMSDEQFEQAGGNRSATHVDFMIGSPQIDIDGIKEDGTREPVMRQGEWAFTL